MQVFNSYVKTHAVSEETVSNDRCVFKVKLHFRLIQVRGSVAGVRGTQFMLCCAPINKT